MVDEWPIWSEQILKKAKRNVINKLLLRKLSISKTDENYVILHKGKKKLKTTELNEISIFIFFCTFTAPYNLPLPLQVKTKEMKALPH
jgi:hypothetical protein